MGMFSFSVRCNQCVKTGAFNNYQQKDFMRTVRQMCVIQNKNKGH